jgi:hypothetical protein
MWIGTPAVATIYERGYASGAGDAIPVSPRTTARRPPLLRQLALLRERL